MSLIFCARVKAFAFFAALGLSANLAFAALPDYKLGDVAAEDVVTPVLLLVVNPEATEALKQKVGQQVQFVVRHTPQSAWGAEAELRASIAQARAKFLVAWERAMPGRGLAETSLDSPELAKTIRDLAPEFPPGLPFARLAPLWGRGASDEAALENLLQPLRDVMAQPIVNSKTEVSLPTKELLRLLPVKSATEPPTAAELEAPGVSIAASRLITLWRARRLVETHFPAGEEELGRFAASFVRINAYPDPALTEIVRAKRLEGVTVNDAYEAAQVVVRRGQRVDRKALNALAVLREKSLIGALQTRLDQQQSVTGEITRQTKFIAAALGVVVFSLGWILWRLRARPPSLVPFSSSPILPERDAKGLPGGDDAWRQRALLAEGKAERAHEAIRTGVLGWMREKLFRTLSHQRSELLSVQQKAEAEMRELEQRLEQLHTPLQERIGAYEKRIEELEKDLAVKGEENRQLIGARITVARQQLKVERERSRFGKN